MRIPGSIVNISEKKQTTRVHAEKSEELFNQVSIRAANIQMKVNTGKTQLLCVHDNRTNSIVQSYIKHGGDKIVSAPGGSLKYLVSFSANNHLLNITLNIC